MLKTSLGLGLGLATGSPEAGGGSEPIPADAYTDHNNNVYVDHEGTYYSYTTPK